jgi:hypothetical protein
MYLAALGRQNSPLSTYFIESLEGVGGGGSPPKTNNKQKQKSPDKSQGRKKQKEHAITSIGSELCSSCTTKQEPR